MPKQAVKGFESSENHKQVNDGRVRQNKIAE